MTKLESELEGTEADGDKNECQKLREENERLKDEIEHRALKGDFNCNARIMHFSMNPAAIASQLAEEKQQALIREVEELRARVQVGAGASAVGVSSLQAQGTTYESSVISSSLFTSSVSFFSRNNRIETNPRDQNSAFEGSVQNSIAGV